MKNTIVISLIILISCYSCQQRKDYPDRDKITAEEILGNANYQAFSFGVYRYKTRDSVPSVEDIKEDLKLTSALGVKLLRTYNTQHYAQATNLLQAIKELKEADKNFEMYVMLGAWIQCKGAWSKDKNHEEGDLENNKAEIDVAVSLAKKYPDIVKMIAVGNESMIKWAEGYFVSPKVILKWVNYLHDLKNSGELSKNLWITSSDNYEAWGGGAASYKTKDLENLINAVDFISLHTYPYHASHYQPMFWGIPNKEENLTAIEKIDLAMLRAKEFAISQYQSTVDYVSSIDINKPIHIGETGWATIASKLYGDNGSHAADEYKEKLFYNNIQEWTNEKGITCFYFKLMDESWKNSQDINGSENNFGLIKMNGQAKFALWDAVDQGVFNGLTRNGNPITKTYNGDESEMMKSVLLPPTLKEIGIIELNTINKNRKIGEPITEEKYIVSHQSFIPNKDNKMTYPSSKLMFNAIDGTCKFKMLEDNTIEVTTGTGKWWACALKIDSEEFGENLNNYKKGFLNFEIKGETSSSFTIGYQTGNYIERTLETNATDFGKSKDYKLTPKWKKYSVSIEKLNMSNKLEDVTSVLSLRGTSDFDGKKILLKNIYYSKN